MAIPCLRCSNIAGFFLRLDGLPFPNHPKLPKFEASLCAICAPKEMRAMADKFEQIISVALEEKLRNANLRTSA